ncbi:MAG: NAD-dependent epimerase/dehydratase family protein [Myxococcota bacterium]|nr:NAD-dependent epimerase/dehydratase family protein [Myxococcota bacterium]
MSTTDRRALVTGGAGFIGHHLVAALRRRGRAVTVLDDLSMGRADRLPADVRLVRGDVRDAAVLADALDGVREVFHLAAVVSVRASVDGFVRDAEVNLLGTLRLLEAMRGRGIEKATLASSMAVYSDGAVGGLMREDHPTSPASPYGAAKLAAEHYWHLVCPQLEVQGTVLRYFNTYGPGQTPTPYVGVITHFAERIARGEPPLIFGDGEQRRDFVHVEDIVAATTAVLDHDVAGRTLNVGTGTATTVNEVARMVLALLESDLTPRHVDGVPGELRNAVASIDAARSALGYRPSRPTLEPSSVSIVTSAIRSRA